MCTCNSIYRKITIKLIAQKEQPIAFSIDICQVCNKLMKVSQETTWIMRVIIIGTLAG